MSSAHSMNARKVCSCTKAHSRQAFSHESSKIGGRGKRETGKTEALMLIAEERKTAQQNKNLSEELKQGLPSTAKVNSKGRKA